MVRVHKASCANYGVVVSSTSARGIFTSFNIQHWMIDRWPCGVTASTLDSESSNRGSNPRKASLHERSRLISRTLVASNLANYKARSTDLFSSPPLAQAADDRTVPSHWKGRGSSLLCH